MKNKYTIPDLESGYHREVTKEEWEAYKAMFESVKPKIDYNLGAIHMFGTSGPLDELANLKEFFYYLKK